MKSTNIEEVFFDSSGSLYKHIGRNQIDSETVALIEIVKNSYDADADEVIILFDNYDKPNGEIIITDNGYGMTIEEFKKYWMCPGTAHKEKEIKSPKWKRVMLGRKGMGRFGTDKISEIVVVKSKNNKEIMGFAAKIDSAKFEEPGAKFQKTPITLMHCINDELKFVQKDFKVGTEIRMKKLRKKWTKNMIKEIREELSKILSPDSKSSNFNISMEVKNDIQLSGKLESRLKGDHSHELLLEVDEKDNYTIMINNNSCRKGNVIDDCIDRYTSNGDQDDFRIDFNETFKTFGPLNGRVLYFNKGGLISRATSRHGKGADHRGVKLYRSGFIVKPYGERNNDWLKLKAKRNTKGWRYYINADKIMGFINIDPDRNSKLEDTTNRQGLIDNDEKKTFEYFFTEIVTEELNKLLENETITKKELDRKKRYQNVSRQVSEIFSNLKSVPIKKIVDENNKRRRAETKKLVVDSELSNRGTEGNRKTREPLVAETNKTALTSLKGSYQKHKRKLKDTDRHVVRPIDTWIEGTRWSVRPEEHQNEESEAWINAEDQAIIYNTAHPMFTAAEVCDRSLGKEVETGSGIAVQIHIHKSVAVAWGLFHEEREVGSFVERYYEYIKSAANVIKSNIKYFEDVPEEELEEIIMDDIQVN